MTTQKIAITVPEEVLTRAKAAVRRGRSSSLSAYVSAAIDQKLMQDELGDLLDEMLMESGGPLTEAELQTARASLSLPVASSRRVRGRK